MAIKIIAEHVVNYCYYCKPDKVLAKYRITGQGYQQFTACTKHRPELVDLEQHKVRTEDRDTEADYQLRSKYGI